MKMPVIFSGHGDPMLALRDDEVTRTLHSVGKTITDKYGKPKAILMISAHWYTHGTMIQSAENPKQIYDMYGFPHALYEVQYPAKGCAALTESVQRLLGKAVRVNDSWGIDHGAWTVLVHMFPQADIPVVQLSVNGDISAEQAYAIGKDLPALREEGYLIMGSGNVVHNLRMVEWDNPDGSEKTVRFNQIVTDAVIRHQDRTVIHFENIPFSSYAVPTPDHYLPLIYCLGASAGSDVQVFNNVCNLGSIAMTSYIWE